MKTIEDVKTVVAAAYDMDLDFFWHIDDDTDEVRAAVNVNDTFFWAAADCEIVEAEDIPLLKEMYDIGGYKYVADLYAARKRKMRPQNAIINGATPEVRAVFLAAGPERPVDFLNPKELEQ